jgi:DNA-binding FadR family transcriptional regulator
MAFHVAIAEAFQNPLLLNLIVSIRSLITIAALIVAPRPRQIWVAHGAPCQNQFLPISSERTV